MCWQGELRGEEEKGSKTGEKWLLGRSTEGQFLEQGQPSLRKSSRKKRVISVGREGGEASSPRGRP